MLKIVIAALQEADLIAPETQVNVNVTFKGQVTFLNLHCGDGAYYHVRISESHDFAAEYASNLDAARRFPRFAPFPLGSGVKENIFWIAYEGLRLRPITPNELLRSRKGSVIHDGILHFCEESRKQTASGQGALISGLSRHDLFDLLHADVPPEVTDRSTKLLDDPLILGLPRTMQHGDMAINNMAIAQGKLVVFDWEDFGKVSLAGFDLAVLAASAFDFEPKQMTKAIQDLEGTGNSPVEWLKAGCSAAQISPAAFARAMPLYLWLFLSLKVPPYSQTVRERVRNALVALG